LVHAQLQAISGWKLFFHHMIESVRIFTSPPFFVRSRNRSAAKSQGSRRHLVRAVRRKYRRSRAVGTRSAKSRRNRVAGAGPCPSNRRAKRSQARRRTGSRAPVGKWRKIREWARPAWVTRCVAGVGTVRVRIYRTLLSFTVRKYLFRLWLPRVLALLGSNAVRYCQWSLNSEPFVAPQHQSGFPTSFGKFFALMRTVAW